MPPTWPSRWSRRSGWRRPPCARRRARHRAVAVASESGLAHAVVEHDSGPDVAALEESGRSSDDSQEFDAAGKSKRHEASGRRKLPDPHGTVGVDGADDLTVTSHIGENVEGEQTVSLERMKAFLGVALQGRATAKQGNEDRALGLSIPGVDSQDVHQEGIPVSLG